MKKHRPKAMKQWVLYEKKKKKSLGRFRLLLLSQSVKLRDPYKIKVLMMSS